MSNTALSIDKMIESSQNAGNLPLWLTPNTPAAVTAALTTCGYTTALRYPQSLTIPTISASFPGLLFPFIRMSNSTAGTLMLCGLEYLLGTLTVSGNSYSNGVSMPIKTVYNQSVQTSASMILAVVTTALTATTPVLTINYTNQDGVTGRSGTITLPTSPLLSSAYLVQPHLQSGDTGIRALSASSPNGLSISAGSAGVIKLYGVLPLSRALHGINSYGPMGPDPRTVTEVPYICSSGESIGFYRFGSTAANTLTVAMCGIASN